MNTKQGMQLLFGHLWDSELNDVGYNNRLGCFTIGEEALHDVVKIWYDDRDEAFKVANDELTNTYPINDDEQVAGMINFLEFLESELEY